nr:MAG TPA: hypothetical protein [Caudoviricetes sp.]
MKNFTSKSQILICNLFIYCVDFLFSCYHKR